MQQERTAEAKEKTYDESKLEESMRPHKKRRFSPDSLELLPKRVLKTRDDLFDDRLRYVNL